MRKLVLAVPFGGRPVAPEWHISMINMGIPKGARHGHLYTKGTKRDEARCKLAEKAIEMGADYLFFADDDTAPPTDALSLLYRELEVTPEAMVCAGIYTNKQAPIEPLVYMAQGEGPHWNWKYGDVFPCWGIATGCMLIRTEVFHTLPKPWFRDIDSIDEVGTDTHVFGNDGIPTDFRMTDDLYFCQKVRNAGHTILAHGGVLPVHFDQRGLGHVLPDNAPPLRDTDPADLWYRQAYVRSSFAKEPVRG